MASFQAPPGHLSQTEVLILSRMVEAKLNVEAPDPELKVGIARGAVQGRLPPRALHAAAAARRAAAARLRRPLPAAAAGRAARRPAARRRKPAPPRPPPPQAPQLTTAEGHKVVGTMAVARAGEPGAVARGRRDGRGRADRGRADPDQGPRRCCRRLRPADAACPRLVPPAVAAAGDSARLVPPSHAVSGVEGAPAPAGARARAAGRWARRAEPPRAHGSVRACPSHPCALPAAPSPRPPG
jgi:hypothetical protein